jgi:drug/metabolite transporter (DMT)-like permease
MLYLILSIVVSTLFGISFKVMAIKNVNSFQAITVNYIVAGALGFLLTDSGITPINVVHQPFAFLAVFLGIVFIACLLFISETTAKQGISVAQVANRMSVVIPITIAILFYNEVVSLFKVLGVLLAISAVYLVSHKENVEKGSKGFWWLLPLGIFLCSGIIDSSVNFAQRYLVNDQNSDAFLSTIFSSAFIFCMFIIGYQMTVKKEQFQMQSIPAGILLGLMNYSMMYCIIKALNSGILEASVLYPINNLSILTLSTIVSVIVFKEKLSSKNWLGIALSLLAIFVLGLLPQLLK